MGRVRVFGRKARDYRHGYKLPGSGTRVGLEKHTKNVRTHRSCLDLDYKFCINGGEDPATCDRPRLVPCVTRSAHRTMIG